MKKIVYLILITACISVLSGCAVQKNGEQSKMETNTKKAEAFELKDLNGNVVKLSDYEGQNVYLEYWASWCPICLSGLEDINTLSAQKNDMVVLTIVAPGENGEKSTEDFKKWFAGVENTENIQVLFDEGGVYTKKNNIRGYPTSQWIGKDGTILKRASGYVDNDAIKAGF